MISEVRTVFAALLQELPPSTIVWKTMSWSYTAEELAQHILDGTSIGKQYVTEVLRVSRDMLAREANRKG